MHLPLDTDPVTKLLLEEVAITYQKLPKEEVATYVTGNDFQHHWQTIDERTSSSCSGLNFSHSKAVSFDRDLSTFHVAN